MEIEFAVKIEHAELIEPAVEIELILCYTAGSISTAVTLKARFFLLDFLKKFMFS